MKTDISNDKANENGMNKNDGTLNPILCCAAFENLRLVLRRSSLFSLFIMAHHTAGGAAGCDQDGAF